jgi:hypothetical protein
MAMLRLANVMVCPEVTGRKVIADQTFAVFTIAEFCRAHRISQSMYIKSFTLRKQEPRLWAGRAARAGFLNP